MKMSTPPNPAARSQLTAQWPRSRSKEWNSITQPIAAPISSVRYLLKTSYLMASSFFLGRPSPDPHRLPLPGSAQRSKRQAASMQQRCLSVPSGRGAFPFYSAGASIVKSFPSEDPPRF